jgi:hypothetical protein
MFALEIYAAMAFGAAIGFFAGALMHAAHDSDEQENKHASK